MEHDERLSVPLRWWVQGTMLVATLWLALVVAVPPPAAWSVTAVALAGMAGFFSAYGGVRVRLREGTLWAGPARIEVGLIGGAVALDAEATRRQSGVDADARAYLLLRPYLDRSVRVDLADPSDPTPYWLVSTRHPKSLVEALETATARLAAGNLPWED